jgi:hypothetical protein
MATKRKMSLGDSDVEKKTRSSTPTTGTGIESSISSISGPGNSEYERNMPSMAAKVAAGNSSPTPQPTEHVKLAVGDSNITTITSTYS